MYNSERHYYQVCQQFRNIRNERSQTQKEVADDLKMSAPYLSDVENGKRPNTSLLIFLKLAEYYNVRFADILNRAEVLSTPMQILNKEVKKHNEIDRTR
ncbi:XRE family transcriptional regulator [Macrococcus brunensis]|uniref:XRE family transcriptional regulator n=1 Tax=Macrococcus brunensis TaxID=198483 RepID=A0A4R6BAN0_9STAP|nr:helix-turn-helix transcriptional regulator [Macrococcus brunensis]TDL93353.1 XRE family transcriptional regulator [Macrococcus brunensis]